MGLSSSLKKKIKKFGTAPIDDPKTIAFAGGNIPFESDLLQDLGTENEEKRRAAVTGGVKSSPTQTQQTSFQTATTPQSAENVLFGTQQPVGAQGAVQGQQTFAGGQPTATQQSLIASGTREGDEFDIFGVGLDARADIRSFLGLETQEQIGTALGDINNLVREGIGQLGLSAAEAKQAIQAGGLSASDVLAAGIESAQGFITEGQQQGLNQISQKFGQAQTALGQGRQDIGTGTATATGGLSPFAQLGLGAQQQAALGATPEGFGQTLEQLRSGGALDPLVAERTKALQSGQGAVGLSRSGAGLSQIAAVPQDILLGLEGQLASRQAALGAQGLGAQQQIAGLQQAGALGQAGVQQNIAQLLQQQGQLGSGLSSEAAQQLAQLTQTGALGGADVRTATGQQLADIATARGQDIATLLGSLGEAQLEAVGGSSQARAEGLGGVADVAGSLMGMFSDERLKKNIVKVGELNGVNIYLFEANELGKKIGMTMNIGVIAQEVEKRFPDLVKLVNGYKTVYYTRLLERIA